MCINKNTNKEATYPVLINQTKLNLLIDSGSTLNLLDDDSYNNLNPIPQLSESDTKIYPYQAKKLLAVLGTFKAVVSKMLRLLTVSHP